MTALFVRLVTLLESKTAALFMRLVALLVILVVLTLIVASIVDYNWTYVLYWFLGGVLKVTHMALQERKRHGGGILFSHTWDDLIEAPYQAFVGYAFWFLCNWVTLGVVCIHAALWIIQKLNEMPNLPFLIIIIFTLLFFFKKINDPKD